MAPCVVPAVRLRASVRSGSGSVVAVPAARRSISWLVVMLAKWISRSAALDQTEIPGQILY